MRLLGLVERRAVEAHCDVRQDAEEGAIVHRERAALGGLLAGQGPVDLRMHDGTEWRKRTTAPIPPTESGVTAKDDSAPIMRTSEGTYLLEQTQKINHRNEVVLL